MSCRSDLSQQQCRRGDLSQQQCRRGDLLQQQCRRGDLLQQQCRRGDLSQQQCRRGDLSQQQCRRGDLSQQQCRRGDLLRRRVAAICRIMSRPLKIQECPTEPILKIAAPQAKLCWLANLRLRQNPGWDGISSRKFAGNFVNIGR